MLDIWDVITNLLGLFLLIGVGYGAARAGILPPSSTGMLSRLLLNVTLPITTFLSLVRPFDAAFLHSGLLIVGLGFLMFGLFALLSSLLARPMGVREGRRGVWIFSSTFSNNGFMGFPIALALFGEEGLALAVFLGIPFNLLAYTFGVRAIAGDVAAQGAAPVSWRKILCSAVNLATLLGLVFYLARLSLPAALESPLQYLSDMTTPLSMLISGVNLSQGRISDLLHDRDVFTISLMRLAVLPLVALGLFVLLPVGDRLVVGVTMIILSMPTAAVSPILAESYGADRELASQSVFLSSLLCLVTIPMISLFL